MKYLIFIVLGALSGCAMVAKKTIQATGTVAETTVEVAGKVTKTAVNTTFDVAGAAFKKGAVTVIDTGTGVSRKVPWEEGLRVSRLNSASERAVEIVRGAQKIKATTDTVLRAGDVVRLN